MDEQEYLKYCLQEIEKKLNWRKSQFWQESDFKKLSDIISNSTKISISPHTLKRLYGKLKYNKDYNPQQATKDALAKFLDFERWDDFILHGVQEKNGGKIKTNEPLLKNRRVRSVVLLFALVAVIFVLIFTVDFGFLTRKKTGPFSFELVDSAGSVPYTVTVNYDISAIKSDSVLLDFDFRHPTMGKQIVRLDKSRKHHNFTYQIPGYYRLKLKNHSKDLAAHNILAMSDDWNSYIVYEQEMRRFWLDNELSWSATSGNLYISPAEIAAQGFDNVSVFYILHRLFKQFDIDGDNFKLETRFMNSKAIGGITCFDSAFRIFCTNNEDFVRFMEEGCSQFAGLKFGETVLSGTYDDLSELKLDTESWNTLIISVKDKHVEMLINDEKVYIGEYEESNGQIIGMECMFKGTGMIDFIRIEDLKSGKIFMEDFE